MLTKHGVMRNYRAHNKSYVKKVKYGGKKLRTKRPDVEENTIDIVVCDEDNHSGILHESSLAEVVVVDFNEEPEELKETGYFVVVDLEATCFNNRHVPRDELEIIEIGAVLIDKETSVIIDKFSTFVKPIIHVELSDFCKELTHITQEDVDNAPGFTEAFGNFTDWMDSYEGEKTFCSWGYYDKGKIKESCDLHGVEYPFNEEHLNVKDFFSEVKRYKRRYSLASAMKKLYMNFEGSPHRGIDDAVNIANVMLKLLSLSNKS